MLQSILEGISQSAASVTTAEVFWCTAASLVLGVLAALLFMFRNEEYSPSLSVTLALLPLVVQVVILLVNGNIGAGVAVAGAFSLVRFRSVPGTAREIGAIFLAAGLFVLTMSGLGVAIANRSETMQQTMFVMFFFVMIFILMSGLITPVESMPAWAQWIPRLLPPRYFVEIMRAVYLKGSLIGDLWSDYVLLAVFAAAFNTLAAATYRKRA